MTPAAGNQTRPGLLWAAFPHMHQIGSSIRVDLVRADGSKSCVINVPKWDFHWQGSYQFTQPIKVNAGDRLQTTCVWDNSAAHQPVVDGVRAAAAGRALRRRLHRRDVPGRLHPHRLLRRTTMKRLRTDCDVR